MLADVIVVFIDASAIEAHPLIAKDEEIAGDATSLAEITNSCSIEPVLAGGALQDGHPVPL